MNTTVQPPRKIRSFVRREGRLTSGQARALDRYWQTYGVELTQEPIDLAGLFGRTAPCIIEIGFGMGEALTSLATVKPEYNFIGIEVYRPGVGALLKRAAELKLTNLRVFCADAVEVLQQAIPDASLHGVHIFFPDPWPKKRHHKRRLIQPEFVSLLTNKLAVNGYLHLATDWEPYAQQMLCVLSAEPRLQNKAGAQQFIPRPDYRPLTKFEQRGKRLGHSVWDLEFVKVTNI